MCLLYNLLHSGNLFAFSNKLCFRNPETKKKCWNYSYINALRSVYMYVHMLIQLFSETLTERYFQYVLLINIFLLNLDLCFVILCTLIRTLMKIRHIENSNIIDYQFFFLEKCYIKIALLTQRYT